MQTAVFVRGRCIGKYSSSYSSAAGEPDFNQRVHELLKQQHRFVLSSIREGRIETLLNSAAAGQNGVPTAIASAHDSSEALDVANDIPSVSRSVEDSATSVQTVGRLEVESHPAPKPLSIEMVSTHLQPGGTELHMCFRVLSGSAAVEGAKVTARLDSSGESPAYSQTVSDCEGGADLRFPLQLHAAGLPVTVVIQAARGADSATRRFRLRRS